MKTLIWNILKKIANLNVTIIALLLIAFVSIIGTILEQEQTIEYYQSNYPLEKPLLGVITWKNIYALGLNHIYTNWWFLCILIFFFSSLIICTLSTQLPVLRYARQWKFVYKEKSLTKFLYHENLETKSTSNLIYLLNNKNYYVFHKQNKFYAYKGILGRIAPIFVHISIILTLTGSILSLVGGFTAQEFIANGEIFHIQNITRSGKYSYIPNNFIGKINNFFIDYHKTHIAQFYSRISLIKNDSHIIYTKTISVNSPLKFQGTTFYQTDWKINALRIKIGKNYVIERNFKNNSNSIWICKLPIEFNNYIFIVTNGLHNSLYIYNQHGKLITQISMQNMILINEIPITFVEIMPSTGLQIKTDPGLVILYPSFLILMLSTLTSYLSYSEIWASNYISNHISISGSTNRGSIKFEDEISSIYGNYIYLLTRII